MIKKIKPYNKVAQVLKSGKIVSVNDIKHFFANDTRMSKVMYRISTYIYEIKLYEQGVVKVYKDGRNVKGYQLLNANEFNTDGRHV